MFVQMPVESITKGALRYTQRGVQLRLIQSFQAREDALSSSLLVPLFQIVQPGIGANLGALPQSFVETGHVKRARVANENLAGEIEAQPAVLQTAIHNAAPKDGTLAATGSAQLVGAAATSSILIGIARTAVPATDSS